MARLPTYLGYNPYLARYNRPYRGCGCLYALLLLLLLGACAWLYPPLGAWIYELSELLPAGMAYPARHVPPP